MFKKPNVIRFTVLGLFASLCACKTTQPPVAVTKPAPTAVYVPEPVAQPAPTPEPYVAPDERWLPGHSSYTTPVPVDPVEVDDLGPVIPQ